MIHDLVNEFISMLRPFKKILGAIIATIGIAILCLTGWNTVRLHRLESSLQDVYFMEYGDGGTTIHKYDVDQRETITVSVINGGPYYDCKINRSENYIIGKFYFYKGDTPVVLLRYNLSDGTMEEIEEIEETKDEWKLPEEIILEMKPTCICWSNHGEKAVFFKDQNHRRAYLYDSESSNIKCVRIFGWNHFMAGEFGWDRNSNYLIYDEGFSRLFAWDCNITIYDIQTGMRTKIYKLKSTTNTFEFVRDME